MKKTVKRSVEKKKEYYVQLNRDIARRAYHEKHKHDKEHRKRSLERAKKWHKENPERVKENAKQRNATEKYWFNHAVCGMRQRSKRRGHPPPDINTVKSLSDWGYANGFKELWDKYVSSGRNQDLLPSIDRIDNDKPYTIANMRLVTWAFNRDSWNKEQKIASANLKLSRL